MQSNAFTHLSASHPVPLDELSLSSSHRLIEVSQAIADRAANSLDQLIDEFRSKMNEPKTDSWRAQMLRDLDRIRYQGLDGIQAQFFAQCLSFEDQSRLATGLNQQGVLAKKALTSAASPLLGAYRFSTHAKNLARQVEISKEGMRAFANDETLADRYISHRKQIEQQQLTSTPSHK